MSMWSSSTSGGSWGAKKPAPLSSRGGGLGHRATRAFPADFFAALNQGNDDEALACMKAEALPEGAPSPRTQELIDKGEWDAKTLLCLVYIGSDACAGRIGDSEDRCCARPGGRGACGAQAHLKNTYDLVPGWYISCGAKSPNVFLSPSLPAEGGPIRPQGAGRLTDKENRFRLSLGQWKFVIDSWHAAERVQVLPDEEEAKGEDEDFQHGLGRSFLGSQQGEDPAEEEAERARSDVAPRPSKLTQTAEEAAEEEAEERAVHLAHLIGTLEDMQRKGDTRMRQLEAEIAAWKQRAKASEDQLTAAQRMATTNEQYCQALHTRLKRLEAQTAREGPDEQVVQRVERLAHDVYSPQGAFMALKLQFTDFREKLESGGGIECHGIHFSSKREMLSWFDNKSAKAEFFLDALAYLHAIRAPVVHQDDASKQRESQEKIGVKSVLEMSVLASFETILPSILVGGKRATEQGGGTYDWLKGYLKTYAVWKPRGMSTGVGKQITEGVRNVTSRAETLRMANTADVEVRALAGGLCQDSAFFCNELVRFIDEQHDELTSGTTFTPEQVWGMQLEFLTTIIHKLSEAREGVGDAARYNPAYYLWGMLRAWQIQQRYIANHFKDDPALTGIMVRRILMHGEDTTVKTKLAKIDDLQRKVEEHHRHFQSELKKLQAAKGAGKDNKA